MRKIFHKICLYCREPFTTGASYQRYCSRNCNLADALKNKSGRIKCIKCWKPDKIEANSEERICNDCKTGDSKRTLDMFNSEELLRYGKIQADRFIKSQKERR